MLVNKPPMGWNSWNTFTSDINETMILETADAMVSTGLKDAGYEYLVIDDCWSERERDENGNLVASHEKFPRGMKFVADYVHSKGLKFGMYSCDGVRTCADYPGSYGHEFQDAEYFAKVGIDYLKYDNCYKVYNESGPMLYNRMSMALKATGRDILFSACNWGAEDSQEWIRSTGAHMYRSTGDITDTFESIKEIALSQVPYFPHNGPQCFNDVDMLVAGLYGKGNVGFGKGCTAEEYRFHFAMWCLMASPLMIGADIRNLDAETLALLTNKDLIAINQDAECRPPFIPCKNKATDWGMFYGDYYEMDTQACLPFFRHLENGEYAIGYFNFGENTARSNLMFANYGLTPGCGYGFELKNIFTGEVEGVFDEIHHATVASHDCAMYRAKMVKLK